MIASNSLNTLQRPYLQLSYGALQIVLIILIIYD